MQQIKELNWINDAVMKVHLTLKSKAFSPVATYYLVLETAFQKKVLDFPSKEL